MATKLTFITGNAGKAAYVAKALGQLIDHHKLDLDELQSMDLRTIVAHKVQQAYDHLQAPVLVEDVALECHALGRLPGPFIKWFIEEAGNQKICDMLGAFEDRSATARICYGLHDGTTVQFFEASMEGHIAAAPRGGQGFGWDQIFVSQGMDRTRAELTEAENHATSMRYEPLQKIAAWLKNLG
ncbi:MAG TPA: non-canonical purine NTP pyrophosphatase [Candidatus Saccharimonadales bacterium]|nr:non-canonical purine NTP pyrophosphatase [Candidatus Saccharimonadales bacterium]